MDAAFKLSGCCESQRKGESIHSPETCLPGSGWEFKNTGTVTIPLPAAGGRLTSQRFNESPTAGGGVPTVQGSGFSGSTPTAGGRLTNQRFNDSTITVNRAVMEKGAYKQLSYFWFPMRGRVLTNIWQMKWYTFWDALTRQRTDGTLVRLITPVYPNESVEDADKRLVAFTREIVPVLNEYLPK